MGVPRRLAAFVDARAGEIYPEPVSGLHASITAKALALLSETVTLPRPAEVLDIGCGQGDALERFLALGHRASGIGLGGDVALCRARGLPVLEMDQSDLAFADGSFDLLWARHVLEHSLFPFFTLSEYRRVLRPAGTVYVEVPAPETASRHEDNPNHYSVLGRRMWLALFTRAGFRCLRGREFSFETSLGPDAYWGFFLQPAA